MPFEFIPITLDIRSEYETIRKNTPIMSADYTFTNLWGWADYYGLSVAFIDSVAIIHQEYPYHCYWAPIGKWNDFDLNIIKELPKRNDFLKRIQPERTFYQSNEIPAPCGQSSADNIICMHRVPEEFAEMAQKTFGESVVKKETRGQWEYIYDKNDLANLSGNRFHKKKNHVNSFYKNYGNNYYEFQADPQQKGSIEEVLLLQEEWCQWHDCATSDSLRAENDVVFRVAGNWGRLGNLIGGSLYAEDKMVAFAIAEELSDDSLVIHFEKAQTDYRGAYQAINHSIVNHHGQNYSFINREQDMDEEGLRKAKESYLPVDYLKKSTLVFTL